MNDKPLRKNIKYIAADGNDFYEGTLSNGERCNLSSYHFYKESDFGPSLEFTLITKQERS